MPSVSCSDIRLALPQEWTQIDKLVRHGFGDDEPFLRAYFDHIWQKYPTLVSLSGNQPVAMTILLPCRVMPQNEEATYLYALTTHPNHRSQGHAKALLQAAHQLHKRLFLHAASPSLHEFYARLGWRDCMWMQKKLLPADEGNAPQEIPVEQATEIRTQLLHDTPRLDWPPELQNFFGEQVGKSSACYSDGSCLVTVMDARQGTLYISELLGTNAEKKAQALAHALGCSQLEYLSPCSSELPGAYPHFQYFGAAFPEQISWQYDLN